MDKAEKLIHAKTIAAHIALMGGPDFTHLPDDELLSKIENIVMDFAETVVKDTVHNNN